MVKTCFFYQMKQTEVVVSFLINPSVYF